MKRGATEELWGVPNNSTQGVIIILMELIDKLRRDDCELPSIVRAHVLERMKNGKTKLLSQPRYLHNPAYDFALDSLLRQTKKVRASYSGSHSVYSEARFRLEFETRDLQPRL